LAVVPRLLSYSIIVLAFAALMRTTKLGHEKSGQAARQDHAHLQVLRVHLELSDRSNSSGRRAVVGRDVHGAALLRKMTADVRIKPSQFYEAVLASAPIPG